MVESRPQDRHGIAVLLNEVLNGKPEAVNALLEQLRPFIQLILRRMLEQWNMKRLEDSDLAQETLMRINNGLTQTPGEIGPGIRDDDPRKFVGWISAIATNVANDAVSAGLAQKAGLAARVNRTQFLNLVDGHINARATDHRSRAGRRGVQSPFDTE